MDERRPTLPPGPWGWRRTCSTASGQDAWGLYTERGGALVVLEALRGEPEDGRPLTYLAVRGPDTFLVPLTPDHPVARLLAAAPELLGALERALPCLEFAVELGVQGDQEFRRQCVENHTVLVAMREAIRKAKGG